MPALGAAALDLLDPKDGERILDVGCGDGSLSTLIVDRGAEVVGVDNSPELAEAAREKGIFVELTDAADMTFDRQFDAAFSNAALHWMPKKAQVARAIFAALRLGGRFAGEMGGEGNLASLREALDEELVIRGYAPPAEATNWYPTPDDFADIYEGAGFDRIDARLIARPTEIDDGITAWVTTFRKGWLDAAGVPEGERGEIGDAVAGRFGSNIADYVRLRFIMRKPA
ncbi:class I SAM-dependent methyltransferase [Sphingomonas sabuli]|uniref:class I SAM-dependent methyltransferase n=1 Tax=Sphingomonas sabuli TaxID=2764186 RepID=UPI001FE9ED51|nr:methyltransferase domain-containing protein [Sphingomonas sabuli]